MHSASTLLSLSRLKEHISVELPSGELKVDLGPRIFHFEIPFGRLLTISSRRQKIKSRPPVGVAGCDDSEFDYERTIRGGMDF